MSFEVLSGKGVSWINIQSPAASDLEQLRDRFRFHPLDMKDLLGKNPPTGLVERKDYLLLTVNLPQLEGAGKVAGLNALALFLGPNYLVTVHDGAIKPLTLFYADCNAKDHQKALHLTGGAGRLLHSILERLSDACFPLMNKLEHSRRILEKEILSRRQAAHFERIWQLQNDLDVIRTATGPLIAALDRLHESRHPVIQEELRPYLTHLARGFETLWFNMEALDRDITRLLNLAQAADMRQTVRASRFLTLIAAGTLPFILIVLLYLTIRIAGLHWSLSFLAAALAGTAIILVALLHQRGFL